jgi:hypothetical protein
MLHQLEQIDVNSLSSEDINKFIQLLQTLQTNLSNQDEVELKNKTNVAVAAKDSFNNDWDKTQEMLVQSYEYDLKQQAKAIAIDSIFIAILNKHCVPTITDGFFESLKKSKQKQNFNATFNFANTTSNKFAIQLCCYAYRLLKVNNYPNMMCYNYYGKASYLRSQIDLYRSYRDPVVQDIIKDFDSISEFNLDDFVSFDKKETIKAATPIIENKTDYLKPCDRKEPRYRFCEFVDRGLIMADFPPSRLASGYRKVFQCEPMKFQHTCVYTERELTEALKSLRP